VIPPGGEGFITLQIDLHNFQGSLHKSATVHTNDPQQPRFNLDLKVLVRPFIEVKPANTLLFRGFREQLKPQSVDLVSTGTAFHIVKTDTSLPQQIAFEVETVEDGKHYRLRVTNAAASGNYTGYILCRTDHPKRPEIKIAITGAIETELSVAPLALLVGRVSPEQTLRTGEIKVHHNRNQTFQISRLTYDDQLIAVSQEAMPDKAGYLLKVAPRLEAVPTGGHRETTIVIETNAKSGTKDQVRVNVVNR
jgi:hypothetical protein